MAAALTAPQRAERLINLRRERERLKATVPETQSHGVWINSMLDEVEKELREHQQAEAARERQGGCLGCLSGGAANAGRQG